ncbi:MAG: adenine deaminase [Oscillospiraceae bacterium]
MTDRLISVAMGREQPDLVLKNCRIVNVFTGELLPGDIAIADGYIAGVGSYDTPAELVDLGGRVVCPGFINAHCHVESSMATPLVLALEEAAHGVTTMIADPHEIANVSGAEGIRWMLDTSLRLPVNIYYQLPSCVPSTAFETAGAALGPEEMIHFLDEPQILGLGEVMNYPGIADCDREVLRKLELFRDRVIDGHAPSVTGRGLQAYRAAGILTDHESVTWKEALEKLRAGIAVLVREGSASKNLDAILTGAIGQKVDTSWMAFCSDDKHLDHIRREGTILHCVRRAVSLGMKPIRAIQMATINAARIYRLHQLGAVAAGYRADLVVLESLGNLELHSVYKDGRRFRAEEYSLPEAVKHPNTVNFATLSAKQLEAKPLSDGCYPVIKLIPGQIISKKRLASPEKVAAGLESGKLCHLAVIERHHATGNVGTCLLRGYGLKEGAIATTVAHDSHNIIVAGQNYDDMLAAAKALKKMGGGYVLVKDGKVADSLPLPIAGLMSDKSADELISSQRSMADLAHSMGIKAKLDPFLTLSFLALPVLPQLRVTDQGVFDVEDFRFLR